MELSARDMRFDFQDEIASHWCAGLPEFSHCVNGFMAALPALEGYFIHNVRAAAEQLADAALREQIEGFVAQEGRHAQQHRRFNQLLARRYPELPRLEQAIVARLEHSRRTHSLARRMAYTAGFEAITYQLVCLLMEKRSTWFASADPHVLSLLCWHAAEEVEHKNVAYDAFKALHGGYLLRVRGLVESLVHTVRDLRRIAQYMLRVDGLWDDRRSRARLRGVRLALARGLLPRFRHYIGPRYDARNHSDPPILLAWLERYREGADLRALSPDALEALVVSRGPSP